MDDESGFDGFPESDIIGDEEVCAGHVECADDGIELVIFDFDAAAEWSMKGESFGGGDGSPADGIEEGIESCRRVKSEMWVGQFGTFVDACTGFEFPDDLERIAESFVIDGGECHEVVATIFGDGQRGIEGHFACGYRGDDELPLADGHELTRSRKLHILSLHGRTTRGSDVPGTAFGNE